MFYFLLLQIGSEGWEESIYTGGDSSCQYQKHLDNKFEIYWHSNGRNCILLHTTTTTRQR